MCRAVSYQNGAGTDFYRAHRVMHTRRHFRPVHEITAFLFVTHIIVRNVIGHAGTELFLRWWLNAPLLRLVRTVRRQRLVCW
jgi:hypothetical protein